MTCRARVRSAPLEGLAVGVLKPAREHVDGLVHRSDAHISRVLILHYPNLSLAPDCDGEQHAIIPDEDSR